jgi:hypothetical protein
VDFTNHNELKMVTSGKLRLLIRLARIILIRQQRVSDSIWQNGRANEFKFC